MGKDKAASRLGAGITSPQPGEDPTPDLEVEVEISPPQTAEDFVLFALERATLEEIVKILRDLYGRKEVKAALNRLHHRDPVSDVIHTRRHAVEIYAKEHGMTPANLMVKLRGTGDGADPAGSERYKLREALRVRPESS